MVEKEVKYLQIGLGKKADSDKLDEIYEMIDVGPFTKESYREFLYFFFDLEFSEFTKLNGKTTVKIFNRLITEKGDSKDESPEIYVYDSRALNILNFKLRNPLEMGITESQLIKAAEKTKKDIRLFCQIFKNTIDLDSNSFPNYKIALGKIVKELYSQNFTKYIRNINEINREDCMKWNLLAGLVNKSTALFNSPDTFINSLPNNLLTLQGMPKPKGIMALSLYCIIQHSIISAITSNYQKFGLNHEQCLGFYHSNTLLILQSLPNNTPALSEEILKNYKLFLSDKRDPNIQSLNIKKVFSNYPNGTPLKCFTDFKNISPEYFGLNNQIISLLGEEIRKSFASPLYSLFVSYVASIPHFSGVQAGEKLNYFIGFSNFSKIGIDSFEANSAAFSIYRFSANEILNFLDEQLSSEDFSENFDKLCHFLNTKLSPAIDVLTRIMHFIINHIKIDHPNQDSTADLSPIRDSKHYHLFKAGIVEVVSFEELIVHVLCLISRFNLVFSDVQKLTSSPTSLLPEDFDEQERQLTNLMSIDRQCEKIPSGYPNIIKITMTMIKMIPIGIIQNIWDRLFIKLIADGIMIDSEIVKIVLNDFSTSAMVINSLFNAVITHMHGEHIKGAMQYLIDLFDILFASKFQYNLLQAQMISSFTEIISLIRQFSTSIIYGSTALTLMKRLMQFLDFIIGDGANVNLVSDKIIADLIINNSHITENAPAISELVDFVKTRPKIFKNPPVISGIVRMIPLDTKSALKALHIVWKQDRAVLFDQPARDSLMEPLLQVFNTLDIPEKRTALKIIRRIYPITERIYGNDPTLYLNSTISLQSESSKAHIDAIEMIDSIARTVRNGDQDIIKLAIKTCVGFYTSNEMIIKNRFILHRMITTIAAEIPIKFLDSFIAGYIGMSAGEPVAVAHMVAAISQFEIPDDYYRSIFGPYNKQDVSQFIEQLRIISDMRLVPLSIVIKRIITAIIKFTEHSSIDPFDITSFLAIIFTEMHSNKEPSVMRLEELAMTPPWMKEALEFCRESLIERPQSLVPFLKQMLVMPSYPSSLIMTEVICGLNPDAEVIEFISECLNDFDITKESDGKSRRVSLIFRAFPSAIDNFYDKLLTIYNHQFKDPISSVSIKLPFVISGKFDTNQMRIDTLFKANDLKVNVLYRTHAQMTLRYLLTLPKYHDQIEGFIMSSFQHSGLNLKDFMANPQLTRKILLMAYNMYKNISPSQIIRLLDGIIDEIGRAIDNPTRIMDIISLMSEMMKCYAAYPIFMELKKDNGKHIIIFNKICRIYVSIPVTQHSKFDKYFLKFIKQDAPTIIKYVYQHPENTEAFDSLGILSQYPKAEELFRPFEAENIVKAHLNPMNFNHPIFGKTQDSYALILSRSPNIKLSEDTCKMMCNYACQRMELLDNNFIKFSHRSFISICKYLIHNAFSLFMTIALKAINEYRYFLIEAIGMIFGKEDYDPELFYKIEPPSEHKPSQIYLRIFGERFYKKHKDYTGKFISALLNGSHPGNAISFIINFLCKDNEFSADFDFLEIYSKCENDSERLGVIRAWSSSHNETHIPFFIGKMLEFMIPYTPIDAELAFSYLRIPKDSDMDTIMSIIAKHTESIHDNITLVKSMIQILANNIEVIGERIQEVTPTLMSATMLMGHVQQVPSMPLLARLLNPITKIISFEGALTPSQRSGIGIHILEFSARMFKLHQDAFERYMWMEKDFLPALPKMYTIFGSKFGYFNELFKNIKEMYNKMQDLVKEQNPAARNINFAIADHLDLAFKPSIKALIRDPKFKLSEDVFDMMMNLLNHTTTIFWTNAVFCLRSILKIPEYAEKAVEIWPNLSQVQKDRLFIAIWNKDVPVEFQYYTLVSMALDLFKTQSNFYVKWYSLHVVPSSPKISQVIASDIHNYATDSLFVHCVIEIALQNKDPILKESVLNLLQNEDLVINLFTVTTKDLMSSILEDKEAKQIVFNTLIQYDDLFEYIDEDYVAQQIKNRNEPLFNASKSMAKITGMPLIKTFDILRSIPEVKLGSFPILEGESLNYYSVGVNLELMSIAKTLGEWPENEFDIDPESDYTDHSIQILPSSLIYLRHKFTDKAIESLNTDDKISERISSIILKERTLEMLDIFQTTIVDAPTVGSMLLPTKDLMRNFGDYITLSELDEYLVVRELRRFIKESQTANIFKFTLNLSPASSPDLHDAYERMRDELVSLAPRNTPMKGISNSSSMLEMRAEKGRFAHLAFGSTEVEFNPENRSRLLTFMMTSPIEGDEQVEIIKTLTREILIQKPGSTSAMVALNYILPKLSREQVMSVLKVLPKGWATQFAFRLCELGWDDCNSIFDSEQNLIFALNGRLRGANEHELDSLITIFKTFAESPQFKQIQNRAAIEDSVLSDQPMPEESLDVEEISTFIGQMETSSRHGPDSIKRVIGYLPSPESSYAEIMVLLVNGTLRRLVMTPRPIMDHESSTYAYCLNKLLMKSPGSYSRKMQLMSLTSIQIAPNTYITEVKDGSMLVPKTPLGMNLPEKFSSVFGTKREYFEWINTFAYRVGALKVVSHMRQLKHFNPMSSVLSVLHCNVSANNLRGEGLESTKTFNELTKPLNELISVPIAMGPLRAGVFAAADAFTMCAPRLRGLGISLFGDDKDKAKDIEERVSSLSLRRTDPVEAQKRVNEIIETSLHSSEFNWF